MRIAAIPASLSAALRLLEPFRVRPDLRLPADWSLPGHCPAQEARWPALGKTVMSVPISAMITSAERRCTPGIVHNSSTAGAKGRNDSRNLIFKFITDCIFGDRASPMMERPPSARGPNSIRP